MRLRQAEIGTFLECIRELYAAPNRDAFITRVLSAARRVVGADLVSFNEVHPASHFTRTWMNPSEAHRPADEELWRQLCGEHPYVKYRQRTQRLTPVRVSDLASLRCLSRTALWGELFEPMGVECQLLAGFESRRGFVDGMGLYRHRRDFSERDRAMLALLHPHLTQAYRNADAATAARIDLGLLERGIEGLGVGVLRLDPDGRIRFATTRARQQMAAYFPEWSGRASRLPEIVGRWVVHEAAGLAGRDALPAPRLPLFVEGDRGRLVLRILTEAGRHVLLLEEVRASSLCPSGAGGEQGDHEELRLRVVSSDPGKYVRLLPNQPERRRDNSMARLVITLLGGFRVALVGGPVVSLPRKAQALLAYLALRPGEAHPCEKLAALLWGDSSDSHAGDSLRHTLAAIRKFLPRDEHAILIHEGRTLALDPARADVDAVTFQRLVAEGTPEALQEAANLYSGDLLEGIAVSEPSFEEWLLAEREQLRELALEALAKLLRQQCEGGANEAAIGTALRMLALDPLQEPVQRMLMRLYAVVGRRGAALRQYQRCVAVLQRELGVEPEPETMALYQDVLRRRPHQVQAGASSGSSETGGAPRR